MRRCRVELLLEAQRCGVRHHNPAGEVRPGEEKWSLIGHGGDEDHIGERKYTHSEFPGTCVVPMNIMCVEDERLDEPAPHEAVVVGQ